MQEIKIKNKEKVQIRFEDNSLIIELTPEELKEKLSPSSSSSEAQPTIATKPHHKKKVIVSAPAKKSAPKKTVKTVAKKVARKK